MKLSGIEREKPTVKGSLSWIGGLFFHSSFFFFCWGRQWLINVSTCQPNPQVKDITRNIRKAVVATTLAELRLKVSAKFQRAQPAIHLDCDGTEIDDEEYFSTLEANAELIAVFPGEQWRDVSYQ